MGYLCSGQLAPRELLTRGKLFTLDDTILLNQVHFRSVGEMLVTLARKKGASARIFSFTNDEVHLCFEKAVHLLGLPEDSVLYQLRHSGASHDLIHHHREFANDMTRGWWVTETSLRRYAKQGRVQRLLTGLPLASRAFRETSIQRIEDVVQGRFLARTVAWQGHACIMLPLEVTSVIECLTTPSRVCGAQPPRSRSEGSSHTATNSRSRPLRMCCPQ